MIALDKLFRLLIRHEMDALELLPGDVPHLVRGDARRPAAKTVLPGRLIHKLLNEIPEAQLDERGVCGETRGFGYRCDDTSLAIEATWTEEGWCARVRPKRSQESADPPPAVPAAPADTATPVQTAPADPAPVTQAAPTDTAAADTRPSDEPTPDTPPPDDRAPDARQLDNLLDNLDSLLEMMLARGASDLHLSSGQEPRLRIHGDLESLESLGRPDSERLERLLMPIAPGAAREQFVATHDADFAYELAGRGRFRVNVFRDHKGTGAVIREIPFEIPTFEQLNLPESLRQVIDLTKGLVLVTGPTGSGKSTTLAALIDLINRHRADHIITIEDPIEFVHPSRRCLVNQREVGAHTASFAQALRAALREDPDIVLVGEMRDLETTSTAIETAETGHLVFGTLHTTTASSTVERLIDQFPADRQGQIRTMLATSLHAVIAQALLKKIGGGRVAAFEVLIATPAVSNLIREGKTFQIASAMQTGRGQGMVLLNDSLFELVKSGQVEPREAYQKAVNKSDLLARYEAERIRFDPTTVPGADAPAEEPPSQDRASVA